MLPTGGKTRFRRVKAADPKQTWEKYFSRSPNVAKERSSSALASQCSCGCTIKDFALGKDFVANEGIVSCGLCQFFGCISEVPKQPLQKLGPFRVRRFRQETVDFVHLAHAARL